MSVNIQDCISENQEELQIENDQKIFVVKNIRFLQFFDTALNEMQDQFLEETILLLQEMFAIIGAQKKGAEKIVIKREQKQKIFDFFETEKARDFFIILHDEYITFLDKEKSMGIAEDDTYELLRIFSNSEFSYKTIIEGLKLTMGELEVPRISKISSIQNVTKKQLLQGFFVDKVFWDSMNNSKNKFKHYYNLYKDWLDSDLSSINNFVTNKTVNMVDAADHDLVQNVSSKNDIENIFFIILLQRLDGYLKGLLINTNKAEDTNIIIDQEREKIINHTEIVAKYLDLIVTSYKMTDNDKKKFTESKKQILMYVLQKAYNSKGIFQIFLETKKKIENLGLDDLYLKFFEFHQNKIVQVPGEGRFAGFNRLQIHEILKDFEKNYSFNSMFFVSVLKELFANSDGYDRIKEGIQLTIEQGNLTIDDFLFELKEFIKGFLKDGSEFDLIGLQEEKQNKVFGEINNDDDWIGNLLIKNVKDEKGLKTKQGVYLFDDSVGHLLTSLQLIESDGTKGEKMNILDELKQSDNNQFLYESLIKSFIIIKLDSGKELLKILFRNNKKAILIINNDELWILNGIYDKISDIKKSEDGELFLLTKNHGDDSAKKLKLIFN